MRIYLSGPITGLDYEAATVRREAVADRFRAHGIIPVTPMRHADMGLPPGTHYKATCEDEDTARRVVGRDSFDVRNCDAILVDMIGATRVSIGTVWEMGLAHALNKPMFLAMEPGNVHEHAMINEGVAWRCDTLDEAVAEAIALLGPYCGPPRMYTYNIALDANHSADIIGSVARVYPTPSSKGEE